MTNGEMRGLPNGWTWARLAEIGKLISGQHIQSTHYSDSPPGVPYLTGPADFGDRHPHITKWTEFPKALADEGDVLITVKGAGVGKANLLNIRDVAISRQLMAIRSDVVLPVYLYYHIIAGFQQFQEMGAGSTVPGINRKQLLDLGLPIPPLAEQRRIVEKIEELFSDLDAGVKTLEHIQRQLQRYRQSVLKAAVEGKLTQEWRLLHGHTVEPADALLERILAERREQWEAEQSAKYEAQGKEPPRGWRERYQEPTAPETSELPELPEGWVWLSLDQLLTEPLSNGRSVPSMDGGFPVLRLTCLKNGRIDLSERKDGAWTQEEAASFLVRRGDFFASRGNGSLDLVGRGGLVEDEPDAVAYPDTMIRIRANGAWCLPRYLRLLWDTSVVRRHIETCARTTAGIYKVNQQHLQETPIPLPPVAEQEQIAQEVERLLSLTDEVAQTIEHELRRAERLRQGILKRAFSGKLVPQDPSDEPADVLLERIRATNGRPRKATPRREQTAQLDLNL